MDIFFNEESEYFPDYGFWLKCPYWEYVKFADNVPVSGSEAILLLMNINPHLFKLGRRNPFIKKLVSGWQGVDWVDVVPNFLQAEGYMDELLARELSGDTLQFKVSPDARTITTKPTYFLPRIDNHAIMKDDTLYDCKSYQINPSSLIRWAASKGIRVAEPFHALLEPDTPKGTPPYLDPNSPNYSSELAYAIKAWEAIYVDGKGEQSQKERVRIEMHIRELYDKKPWKRGTVTLDGALSTRLLTLTTPDKDMPGGRPQKGPTLKGKK